jgi:transposase
MSDRFDHTLEHRLETKPANGADDSVTTVRRIELITGDGRRRRWSDDEKARIVVESLRPGVNISEVARRNGLSPQQLFGWRREARSLIAGQADASDAPPPERSSPAETRRDRRKSRTPGGERSPAERAPAFASVVVATSAAAPTAAPPPASLPASPASGRIEIAFGDAIVRVIGQVEPATLATVLRVVRRTT